MAGEIATAYVLIRPETRAFKSQAERELIPSMRGVGTRVAGAFAAGFIIRGAARKLFVDPIKQAGDFQQSLNVLWATADHGKVTLKQVSDQAIKLGNDTKLPAVSAKDAADAMVELGKGGFTAAQAMKAARGTLLLATAAQLGNAQAATILSDALHTFGLEASDAARVTDLLAAAANRSTTGVPEIALALSQVGASAHALHVPIQDTVAAITQLANAGIKGSDAGTSLKTTFQRLIPTTKQAKDEVAKLGINVKDNHGNFVGLHNIIGQYSDALKGVAPVERAQILNTIFGSDAVRAANVLLTAGTKKYDANRKAIEKHGAAQRLANAQTKGFNGALSALSNAFDTLQLRLGLKLLPKMTTFIGFLSKLAGAKSFNVAVNVAINGIKNLGADIGDMLFGSSKTITIGGSRGGGHQQAVVVDPGLIASLQASIAAMLATTDWGPIGASIGAGISKSIVFSERAFNGIYNAGLNWANTHSGQIANLGAIIGLKVVSKLLDPAFWLHHWQLIGGIVLSVFPVGRFAGLGGKLASAAFGRFGAEATSVILKGLAKLPDSIGTLGLKLLVKLTDALGTGGSNAVAAALRLVTRITNAIAGQFGRLGPLVKVLLNTAIVTTIGNLIGAAFSAAVHLAERIAAGIKTAPAKLVGLGGDLINKISTIIVSVATTAYNLAISIGGRITDGIIQGIKGLPGALANKLKSYVSSAVDKAGALLPGSGPWHFTIHKVGEPLVEGILLGVKTLGPRLAASLSQQVREAVTAGKRNLYSLTSSLASDLGTIIDAATAKFTNPLSDQIAQHQADRQKRDLTATRDAAAAAKKAGPQPTATDEDGNPVPLTADEAAKQAADLNQAYMDAQQDLDDFMLQAQIDAAQKQAGINQKSASDQITIWTQMFNQGKISQAEFLGDITTLVNTYAAADGLTAYQNMGDLLGQGFANSFIAHLGDITAQIQQIVAGGQSEGGAALGEDSPQSSIDPVSGRLTDAQKDLTKQNAALAKARGDLATLTKKLTDQTNAAIAKGGPGGVAITPGERAAMEATGKRVGEAQSDLDAAQAAAKRDKDLIDVLKPLVDQARAIQVGTINIMDPAVQAAVMAATR